MVSQIAALSVASSPSIVTSEASNRVLDWGQGSWYRRHGLPVVGWSTARDRPLRTVLSNADVETLQVSLEMSLLSHDGRYLKNRVDEEKRVNPVSLGEEVAPWKS